MEDESQVGDEKTAVEKPEASDKESDASFYTDFESVSSCSEASEIPEVILESSSESSSSRRRTVVLAWPTAPAANSLEDTNRFNSKLSRTPVRRARVRGTVCLPTSFVFTPGRRTPPVAAVAPVHPVAKPTEAEIQEQARLELERELAQKAAFEEALEAERASYEAELARKTQEAEDRQAILNEVAQDRAELVLMYRRANQELSRLRAELSQRTLEVLELRQDSKRQRTPGLNKCVVCLDEPARLAFVPCGHLASCEVCAQQMSDPRPRCPVCRRRSESILPIYLP